MNSAPFRLDLSPNSVASEVNQINYAWAGGGLQLLTKYAGF